MQNKILSLLFKHNSEDANFYHSANTNISHYLNDNDVARTANLSTEFYKALKTNSLQEHLDARLDYMGRTLEFVLKNLEDHSGNPGKYIHRLIDITTRTGTFIDAIPTHSLKKEMQAYLKQQSVNLGIADKITVIYNKAENSWQAEHIRNDMNTARGDLGIIVEPQPGNSPGPMI